MDQNPGVRPDDGPDLFCVPSCVHDAADEPRTVFFVLCLSVPSVPRLAPERPRGGGCVPCFGRGLVLFLRRRGRRAGGDRLSFPEFDRGKNGIRSMKSKKTEV